MLYGFCQALRFLVVRLAGGSYDFVNDTDERITTGWTAYVVG